MSCNFSLIYYNRCRIKDIKRILPHLLIALFLASFRTLSSSELPTQISLLTLEELHAIGQKIWNNECRGTNRGLTSWNLREEFASMGIGHFIWYPEGGIETFRETFPLFIDFAKARGERLPSILLKNKHCPWKTREAFYEDIDSSKMQAIRDFLSSTFHLQAAFILERFRESLQRILKSLKPPEKQLFLSRIHTLASTPEGIYALADYVNFKGEGLSPNERYQGEGWGLMQVVLGMKGESTNPKEALKEFIRSAKDTLENRVRHSPKERAEERWLKGWENRLDTYSQ